MAIFFQNSTQYSISVAISLPDPNCSCGWNKTGWWNVEPGRKAMVKSGDTKNLTFWYYVEDKEGSWGGPYDTTVPDQRFNKCWMEKCTPCRVVGFKRGTTDDSDEYTINMKNP
ncbi:DUF1036 domain-containing protein [Bacillus cereus]|uniref:DUF1036 domain-containing protein n=2 Tax=Bacillus TaxID=1386 RepID=UPI000B4B6583|nr:DUF1036 domain-containing protein [Bacillus cereus]